MKCRHPHGISCPIGWYRFIAPTALTEDPDEAGEPRLVWISPTPTPTQYGWLLGGSALNPEWTGNIIRGDW